MHPQSSEDGAPRTGMSDQTRDNGVIALLWFEKPTLPWSVDEIEREMREPAFTTDSINRLVRIGLLHRSGDYVWLTRTACYASEIQIGT
jgi:hypothetical protein